MTVYHIARDVTFLASAPSRSLLQRLDPERSVALAMALLGLTLLGLLLVACIMIGARWVRRMSISKTSRPQPADESWRKKLADSLPDVAASDTMIIEQATDETIAD